MESTPRRVTIGAEERGGWSSERPLREGEAAREPRRMPARVLEAASSLTYSPHSLIVVAAGDTERRERLLHRLFPAQLLLSHARATHLIEGRLPAEQLAAGAEALLTGALRKRMASGQPAVVETATLGAGERTALVALAEQFKRPAHLIVLDAGRGALADEDTFYQLRALVASARNGEVGLEGFRTVLVLGRSDVDALTAVEFVAPRAR